MPRLIKVFGERNTATRAVKQMLRNAEHVVLQQGASPPDQKGHQWQHLHTAVDQHYSDDWRRLYMDALRDENRQGNKPIFAWKHAAPEWDMGFLKHQINVVFLIRNPYSWRLSTALKPYHIKGPRTADFATFITRPWLTERRDNVSIVLPSVLDLWTTKLTAYQDFADMAGHFGVSPQFVSFEAFVQNPQKTVCTALNSFGIPTSGISQIDTSTKDNGKNLTQLQQFYHEDRWKGRLTKATVELINERLDCGLVERFGYKILDPDDFPEKLPELEQRRFAYEMMALDPQPSWSKPSHRKAGSTATA